MSDELYWIWLSAAELSVRSRWRLLEHFGGDAQRVYLASEEEYRQIPGLSAAERKVLALRDLDRAASIRESCRKQKIRILPLRDEDYPQRLRQISDPPVLLYVKGELPKLDDCAPIALIGTRKASHYGHKMGRQLAYELARCGVTILSLVGSSLDDAVLRGALRAEGCCVAVLATPLDVKCRREQDILCRGALISEVAPGTPVQKSHFRDRNRIAAGLSLGVLVLEAPEKSGTRLFCREALEQGKEIFALPGNADAAMSAGCLQLIKEGAKLVTCGQEVVEEFLPLYPETLSLRDVEKLPEEDEEKEALSKEPEREAKAIDKAGDKGYIDLKERLEGLSEVQRQIMLAIEAPSSPIDDVIETTGLSAAKVLAQLTVLEIKGLVCRVPGRRIAVNTAKK